MTILIILIIAIGLLVIAGAGLVAAGRRPTKAPSEAPAEAPPAAPEAVAVEELVRPNFRDRLGKARASFTGYLGSVRSRSSIDETVWDELEEALILADVGVPTTTALLEQVRATVDEQAITDPEQLLEALKEQMKADLEPGDRTLQASGAPAVWLFVGVNGVGKTTTIGKLGYREIADGNSVVMAAGDTFRAAAAEQLELWSERAGADFVRGSEGGDPGSVVYDAIEHAASEGSQLVMADTAGRLHTNSNLMEELRKVRRVADKGSGTVTEVLLVLDATTGQNGLVQAAQFTEAVDVTGVALTKLDGSAKGGVVIPIHQQFGLPVRYIGLGEQADDLALFSAEAFVDALFADDNNPRSA
jgi:fused signal recognition particle receptor